MNRAARMLAGAAAVAGWTGLALQFWLIVGNLGLAAGTWRFIGFFTILTNIGAAIVATAIALGGRSGLGGPRARLMAATSIIMVGIVYSVALRSLWNPQGLQKAADVALHDATPLLWLGLWLAAAPRLAWRDVLWALVPPLLYCCYALARGAVDGWYAYWFLNPAEQSIGELLVSIAILLAGAAILALLLIAVARLVQRRKPRSEWMSIVDEAGRESFPASDPPGWTLGEDRKR